MKYKLYDFFQKDGFGYIIPNGTVYITDCPKDLERLEIPSQIDGVPVTALYQSALDYTINTLFIALPEGMVEIGEEASELKDLHEELSGESLTESVDSAMKRVLDSSVRTDHLPSENNGDWVSGTRGNGKFVLHDNAVIMVKEGVYVTGKLLKEKYGFDGVAYKDNDPDFKPYAVSNDTVTTVPVDKMPTNRNESYRLAEKYCSEKFGISRKQVRQYMEENNLTWHETPDRKSIMPIPTEINAAYKHTGGISKQQSFEKLARSVNETCGGRPIKLCRPAGTLKVEAKEVCTALTAMKKKNSSY